MCMTWVCLLSATLCAQIRDLRGMVDIFHNVTTHVEDSWGENLEFEHFQENWELQIQQTAGQQIWRRQENPEGHVLCQVPKGNGHTQCWSNTEANKTCLHCFLLTNLLELVTDLTHNTEENSEHPQSHPYTNTAVTQFWHPRKMHITAKKKKKSEGKKKPKRELRTRGDDVHVQLAHHTLKSLPRPIPDQQTLSDMKGG